VRTGTIVRAWRRQIGILILWDGDAAPTPSRHDAAVNPLDDAIDMLDGRGVRVGMRVEELPEGRFRLTGGLVEVEAESEPSSPRGIDTPEKFMAWAKSLPAAGRLDAWITANGGAKMPLDPDDLDDLLDK
jgi:hypothetical protein